MNARRGFGRRVLIDVAVGLVIIAFAGLLFAISLVTGKQVPGRWIAFVCMTPLIFWAPLTQVKRYWRRRSLWLASAALLIIHIGLFTFVLSDDPAWRPAWFTILAVPEGAAIFLILYKLVVADLR